MIAAGRRGCHGACQCCIQGKWWVSRNTCAAAVRAAGNARPDQSQCVFLPVKAVAARTVRRIEFGWAGNAELRNCKLIEHHTHRQAQRLGRLAWAFFGLPVVYHHACGRNAVKLERTANQCPRLPGQRDVFGLHRQAILLPGDAVCMPTPSQRPAGVLHAQVFSQLRRIVICPAPGSGQRTICTSPPPQTSCQTGKQHQQAKDCQHQAFKSYRQLLTCSHRHLKNKSHAGVQAQPFGLHAISQINLQGTYGTLVAHAGADAN